MNCQQCCARDYLTAQRLQRVSASMHASVSLCVYALVHVSACTYTGTMPPGFFLENTSFIINAAKQSATTGVDTDT